MVVDATPVVGEFDMSSGVLLKIWAVLRPCVIGDLQDLVHLAGRWGIWSSCPLGSSSSRSLGIAIMSEAQKRRVAPVLGPVLAVICPGKSGINSIRSSASEAYGERIPRG